MGVTFAGAREGRSGLAWGQRAIYDAMRIAGPENAHYFNIWRLLAMPRGRGPYSPAEVCAAVGALIARHDALRARVSVDGDGLPYQTVASGGGLTVRTVACAEPEAEKAAEGLALDLASTSFDLASEWPIRIGLITCDDAVRQVAVVLCHTAADGYAADIVMRDLRQLLLRGTIARPPSQQLLDLVAEQESGVGRNRSERAIAHWEAGYRVIPPVMFPDLVAEPGAPRWSKAILESRALEDAVTIVARRHHMSTATVLLTAVTSLIGTIIPHELCAITPIVHNRFRPETRDLVTTLSQLGLFTLAPEPDATLAETLEATQPEAMRAYRHAQYDQPAWDAMVDRVSAERGVRVYPSCCFNDLRPVDHSGLPDNSPGEDAVRTSVAASRIEWLPGVDHFNCDFCFFVTRQSGILSIGLSADTCRLPQDRIVGLLRSVEELVVESAFRDAKPGEVAP
ncbi:condensation domain-containing protein [Acrocarpospora catenulata]|uniref:condensation domain-containing protein n=1 Tax=Acrocarpospora catenulata TaxID=2836182 RepID=UPI001BDA4BF8|nr:condensation domain-containing protein [Acrocarpospora catenulata]